MSDLKISQLSDGGASQAADEYVVARSGANYRIDGASVAAAATSVGTLAGLTMTGNLTLDTDVVMSRGAANRLDLASGDSLNLVSGSYQIAGTNVLTNNTLGSGVTASSLTSVGTLTSLTVSGDLTVDTTTLKVDSAANSVGIGTTTLKTYSGYNSLTIGNNGNGGVLAFRSSYNSGDGAEIYQNATGTLLFNISSTLTAMRIDTSGNLGLGVTPSTWFSNSRALQLGSGGAVEGRSNVATYLSLSSNAFLNSAGTQTYITSDVAARYLQQTGAHIWQVAASGTAGNAITFTSAMTLNANGQLNLNTTNWPTTSIGNSAGRHIIGGTNDPVLILWNEKTPVADSGSQLILCAKSEASATTIGGGRITGALDAAANTAAYLKFDTTTAAGFVERARILSGGAFVIGNGDTAASPATANLRGTDGTGTDIAGAEFRITGGRGTGSGAGGPITFYTSAAGASGTTLRPPSERARITAVGNVLIGGTADRGTTVGTNHLSIFNGTAPAGTLTNGISLYSSAGEAYVMDAAGNATLFSPHDAETNAWIFRSKHTPTGKVLKIDVEKMLRFINDHFGLDAIHEFVEA